MPSGGGGGCLGSKQLHAVSLVPKLVLEGPDPTPHSGYSGMGFGVRAWYAPVGKMQAALVKFSGEFEAEFSCVSKCKTILTDISATAVQFVGKDQSGP